MKHKYALLIISSLFLSTFFPYPESSYADVTFESLLDTDGQPKVIVKITSQITEYDYHSINKFLNNKVEEAYVDFDVDSLGGDVEAAINIGRLARKYNASVSSIYGTCASSCVFILAGGVDRHLLSSIVGIHRPFLPNDNETTIQGQKKQQNKWEAIIKEYLKSVNISTDLYDEMFRIEPSDMKILTSAELERYGLNKPDPYWQDAQDTISANRYGLTKQEYIKRNAKANSICYSTSIGGLKNTLQITSKCVDNILNGLDPLTGIH